MDNFAISQAHVFLIFILNGIVIAFIFDIFRIFRKSFQTPDWITYIEDIIFWFITCIILAYSIYTYNNGQIRLFMFIGLIIGAKIIQFLKKIIVKIIYYITYPAKIILKIIRKLLLKPICFIFINFRRNIYKFLQKNLKKSLKTSK